MSELADLYKSLPQAATPVVRSIVEAQTRHLLFPIEQTSSDTPVSVVVGVSGGADSTCLLHALSILAPFWNLDLHVAHLDHRLRPESAGDAVFVGQLAADLGLPWHLRQLERDALHAGSGGLENAARDARYLFLCQIAHAVTPPLQEQILVVAHQKNDQAETLIMNLLRGSGLNGLSAMPWIGYLSPHLRSDLLVSADPSHPCHGTTLVRPLLNVDRAEILSYLQAFNLEWREDSTNQDTTRLRNRVRHDLLPMLREINENVIDTLARTAQILAGEADRASHYDHQTLDKMIIDAGIQGPDRNRSSSIQTDRIVLDFDQFLALDIASQRGMLRLASTKLGVDLRELGFTHIESLIWRLRAGHHKSGTRYLLAKLASTVIAAQGRHPARLSLHLPGTPPLPLEGPHLNSVWRAMHASLNISCPGTLAIPDGWNLRCRLVTLSQLPSNWCKGGSPWRAFVDAGFMDRLILTTPYPGLRFTPLGLNGHHKSLGDFFTSKKVPKRLRYGWPLILDSTDGQIVWVCGQDISHHARITSSTRQVLWLQWHQDEADEIPPTSQFHQAQEDLP